MGTPAFAVAVLATLVDAGHDVVGVYSQPDRPAGRGRRTTPTPVKAYALDKGLEVFQPASLREDEAAQRHITGLSPEVIVVAAYGLFLPNAVLEAPGLGCLNVHPSLLPTYRGPSPVATAILSGDEVTGVTVMEITEQMDSGPIVAQQETPIGTAETTGELTDRLFQMGATLLVDILPAWAVGELRGQPQDNSAAITTRLLTREDGAIDWRMSADQIARQVRAYDPWPGTFTLWDGRRIKVLEASIAEAEHIDDAAGTVVSDGGSPLGVVTGDRVLELKRLQLEGRRAAAARDFVQGQPDFVGARLD